MHYKSPSFFRIIRSVLTTVLSLFAVLRLARAYLDPGSGSFLIQILVAGLIGAGLAIRAYWGRIVGLFKRSRGTSEGDDSPSDVPPPSE